MRAHIKLGRVYGVEIGLHLSWLAIAVLITLSLAARFTETSPAWSRVEVWATSAATALLFFATLVAHELSHVAVAKRHGLPVRSITLFALGGVATIEREAADARTEFLIAFAGPVASVMIGLTLLGTALLVGWRPPAEPQTVPLTMLLWLGYINLALAAFNMIPGYPLDGGRVLRALIWRITGSAVRATRIATATGQFVATFFILFGLVQFFRGAGLGALWMAFIGWFLLEAARASRAQIEIGELLAGVRVGEVMRRDCPVVDGRENLQLFVDERLLRTGHRCFVVEEQGRVSGLITANEVKRVPRARWVVSTVDEVSRPLEMLHRVAPGTPLSEALEVMRREDVGQLPVIENSGLAGVITRANILSVLQTRAEMSR